MTSPTVTHIRRNQVRRGGESVTPEILMRDSVRLLNACGVHRPTNWISRTIRQYLDMAAPKGMPFGAYLLHRVELNAEQRRMAMSDPELHNFLCYSDPTGETAVRNVMRRHG